jgi:hypothetical protein
MITADFIWALVSFLLTLMVLSYLLIGDNPLFRVATYALVGVSAAYIALTVFNQVIWPKFFLILLSPAAAQTDKLLLIVPLLLSLLLLAKLSPRLSRAGNVSIAFLVGVGAATIIGGAVLGTIFPQALATANLFDLRAAIQQGNNPAIVILDAVIVLIGTAATLLYFHFGATPKANLPPERPRLLAISATVGQVFIAITLGSLFAGVYMAALTAMIDRIYTVLQFIL